MAIYRMINGNLEKIAGASNSLVFSVSIPTQNWIATGNGGAYIDVPVLGITVNDNPIVSLEIVETDTLSRNKCLIETDNSVIDCSIDTQIKNLITDLRMLSKNID